MVCCNPEANPLGPLTSQSCILSLHGKQPYKLLLGLAGAVKGLWAATFGPSSRIFSARSGNKSKIYLPTYLPSIYLPTYLPSIYLPTYLQSTYLPTINYHPSEQNNSQSTLNCHFSCLSSTISRWLSEGRQTTMKR